MAPEEQAEETEASAPSGSQPGNPADDTDETELTAAELEDELGELVGEEDADPEGDEPEADEEEAAETDQEESDEDAEGEDEDAEEEEEARSRENSRAEKRIRKLTGKLHDAEEARQKAEARVGELEELAQAGMPLDPYYLSASEAKLLKEAEDLESEEAFLLEHIDGFDHPKDEAKSLTSAEVRQRYAKLQPKLRSTVFQANQVYDRAKKEMARHLKLGRKYEQAMEARKAKVKTKVNGKKPSALPARSTSTTRKPTSQKKRGMNEERFKKAGGTAEAAEVELAELL